MSICKVCDKEWQGLAECHCSGCHEHFRSISGFDKHRIGRRCLTVEEMLAKKMIHNQEKGFWITESRPEGLRYDRE